MPKNTYMMFGHSPISVRPCCDKTQGVIHVQKPLETQVVADEEENTDKNWFQNAKLTASGVFDDNMAKFAGGILVAVVILVCVFCWYFGRRKKQNDEADSDNRKMHNAEADENEMGNDSIAIDSTA